MKKLLNLLISDEKKQLSDFLNKINSETSKENLSNWYYQYLIPKWKNISKFTFEELKSYMIERRKLSAVKNIENHKKHITQIKNSGEFISARISVEWKKNRTWGANPTATAWITYKDISGVNSICVKSGSIGGCGFDKLSTSVADALNQSHQLLSVLDIFKEKYLKKNKETTASNRDIFGYGSGYGILPNLEGGVGVSCFVRIFETVGFEFKQTASGSSFDCFEITKKKGKK